MHLFMVLEVPLRWQFLFPILDFSTGIFCAFCVRVPLSFVIHHFYPDSIFLLSLATPSSTVVQIILCFIYYNHEHNN